MNRSRMTKTKSRARRTRNHDEDKAPASASDSLVQTVATGEAPAVLTVAEAARVLRIGRNAAYAAVADGTIRLIRVGRSIRISRRELDRLLESAADGFHNHEANASTG